MNEILKTIKSRRSVRAYTEQQISQEDLSTILEAATYAPSGMGLQTWHFTAIQNGAVLEELNEKIKGAFAMNPVCRNADIAGRIVVIIMLLHSSLFPTNRHSGGQAWIVPVPCRIFSLQPSLSASVPAG